MAWIVMRCVTMTTHDNDEAHDNHAEWSVVPVCVYCLCRNCGCPHEPTIGEHIHLGEE